jgi:hypothetical protein
LSIALVILVGEKDLPLWTSLGEHDHADDTTRAAVPLDSLRQGALHKRDSFTLIHSVLPVRVAVSVDVGGSRAADGVRLLVQRTAERDRVYLTALALVPTRDDDACT